MYFDTHAHYDARHYNEDRDDLLCYMRDNGVSHIINNGCDLRSSKKSIELAEKYDYIYAAIGWQPQEHKDWKGEESLKFLRKNLSHPKVVAIGEIGLDYYWEKDKKEIMKEILHAQLKLAVELDMPVVIHDRESHADIVEALLQYPNLRGVIHCFSGSVEMAKILVDAGFYLGFDGPVTYKNARKSLEVLEYCPLEKILIETDAPYLTPVPYRGERNDSTLLYYVVDKIAEVKGKTHEEIAKITSDNAKALFRIA